jgi:DNA-binding transcriptional ArsR family regulator
MQIQPSDLVLTALADPTRRAILAQLAQGEITAGEVAAPFAMTQPAVSHHLKVLERAGLIRRRIDGQRRPCRLVPEALAPVERWLADLRRAMEQNYARLDAVLADDSNFNEGTGNDPDS